MIHIGRADAFTLSGALSAERLTQELRRPELVLKYRQIVPPVPGCSVCAASAVVSRLMPVAVSASCQLAAAGMCTRSQRLLGHGLSPPGKNKSTRTVTHSRVNSSGASAQAHSIDVDDGLSLTVFAVDRHVLSTRFREQPQDFLPAANRA